MNHAEYKQYVKSLKVGKRLPDAVYLHKSVYETIPSLYQFVNQRVFEAGIEEFSWDIIKLFKKKYKLSFLSYPTFFSESYPPLAISIVLDLKINTTRKTDYSKSENPPILHRKETFLLPTHPAVKQFSAITKEGELAGLYKNTHRIGFKKNWETLIKNKGYLLRDGRLVQDVESVPAHCAVEKREHIDRHKTAIDRNCLSSPVQSLFRHSYLQGKYSLFDYGCGKGDDLKILAGHGIKAHGWDPVYWPNNDIIEADIVNLGFVVNVIENPSERQKTLQKAYRITRKILVASVMLGGKSITGKFEKYGDGVVTSRNTFQKYYSQTEFREYLQNTLGETAIAVGPGIFYVFKDKLEEQRFLVERQRIKQNWQKLSYADHPERLKVKQRALYERHNNLFQEFWQQCLDFGRIPVNNEFAKSEELRALCGSHQKGLDLLTTIHGQESYTRAAKARRDDLLVHYALGLFGQRKPYKHMPDRLKRDVKYFFGNYTSAIEEATELLFSVGEPELINQHCEQAYKVLGRGRLEVGHSLTIHRNDVELLSAPLRVYIGCATQLYGDIETVDLVKIHIRSGKVSLMRYDDFEGKALPLLEERIKIKLREQAIDFYKYGDKFVPQPIYLKSRYLDNNFANYKKQVQFDQQLVTFSWLDLSGYGPEVEEFTTVLAEKEGLTIESFGFTAIN